MLHALRHKFLSCPPRKKKNLIRTANEPDMILSGKYDTVGNAHNSLWIKLGQDKEQGITW
jgi:hypothetical protein